MLAAKFLDDWNKSPGDELEETFQRVLKEHRLAAFEKLIDLLFCFNPDKNPPTISLDDTFLWLLNSLYLGRWW